MQFCYGYAILYIIFFYKRSFIFSIKIVLYRIWFFLLYNINADGATLCLLEMSNTYRIDHRFSNIDFK